nr:MAG TPA: hypothetical protein [Caudoviricetes sp.]DAV52112.1 MAG TPA: hypothetical protein [Caudoviricetes sp.]
MADRIASVRRAKRTWAYCRLYWRGTGIPTKDKHI